MNELWQRADPGFLDPIWLAVGALALLAVFLLDLGAQRQRRQALQIFAASHLIPELTRSLSSARRRWKRILLLAAVALLFVAMARPYLFYKWNEERRSGLDVLLAIDCSKSMLTDDVKPNRLERAKLAVADFADRLPNNRLGLIAFAGDAFLECPMTLDHDAFQDAVRELDTNIIPRPGTDIATAIDEAVLALKSQPNNMKFLILITDGEDLEGRAIDAAKAAAQAGMKIYTVGVGTPGGGPIPEVDDSGAVTFHHDSNGQVVQSKLDESTLKQIAQITGAAYEPLGQRGEGLEAIYDRYIASLPKQALEERREKIHFERFEWPLGLAILCLALEFMIRERAPGPVEFLSPAAGRPARRRARLETAGVSGLVILGLLFLAGSTGTARAAATDKAERDYKSGNYNEAAEQYDQAIEKQPDRHDLQYDDGDAAYKAGEYTEAEGAFHKALETPDLKLQENTYYNLGNAQFKHGEAVEKMDSKRTTDLWEQALHSYDSALKLREAADTRYNYDVVKKKLEQLKQQQKQQQQQQNQQNQQDKNSQSQSQQGQGQSQNQPDQGKQNPSQPNDQNKPGDQGQKKDEQPQSDQKAPPQQRARSDSREQDKQDPGIKSREDAEELLDSLKDDERHVTSRTLNTNNDVPQPPPSGKDW